MSSHVPLVTISALHYAWETVEQAFDRCHGELQLGGIEFSLVRGGSRPHLLESEYDQVHALGAAYPLELSGHIWDDLPSCSDPVGALRDWLAVAEHLGMTHIIVHGGACDDRRGGVERMTEAFGEAAPLYAEAGVTLCLENHYAWEYRDQHELFGDPAELRCLLDRVPAPGVGFCLDYGHSHMTGDTERFIDAAGDRLVYTHLADNLGEHDDHLAFGRGTAPWLDVLTYTRDAGYRGPFTVEYPVRDEVAPLAECLAMLREVYSPSGDD